MFDWFSPVSLVTSMDVIVWLECWRVDEGNQGRQSMKTVYSFDSGQTSWRKKKQQREELDEKEERWGSERSLKSYIYSWTILSGRRGRCSTPMRSVATIPIIIWSAMWQCTRKAPTVLAFMRNRTHPETVPAGRSEVGVRQVAPRPVKATNVSLR